MSNKAIKIDFCFIFINGSGKQVMYTQLGTPNHFAPVDDIGSISGSGYSDFSKHSKLMSSLVDGALVIQVNMKLASPPFSPKNPSACKVIQGLFLSNNSSDIVFKVQVREQSKGNTMKVAKAATVSFPAHWLIVESCSTILVDVCESNDDGKIAVPIDNVSPEVFHFLLSYIYGMKFSNDGMEMYAREIIDTADRFGVVNLKLEAETFYVEATNITMKNVMELWLYADSKNCALLKKAAMDYIVENKAAVIDKLSFTDTPGTFMLKAYDRSEKWMSGVLHVGTPSPEFTNWTTKKKTTKIICIHKFARLTAKQGGISFDLPKFEGLGNQWCLTLRQGEDSGAAKGMVSIYLKNMSNKAINIEYSVSIIDGNGKQVAYKRTDTPHCFGRKSIFPGLRWLDFAKCSTLMNLLVHSALIIIVNMKVVSLSPFILPNPSACEVIQSLFLNVKSNDIVFEVGGEEQLKNGEEKAKSMVPLKFPVHRCIVETCSTTLAELFESNGNGTTPIPIDNVSPDIFRLLLSYIYGTKISNDEMKSHAREIIDASDRFGVVNLKLEAESFIVEDTTFTTENVKELLLYAESKNCALLKETSIDYIVENKADIMDNVSFVDAPGTLLNDMLVAFIRSENENGAVGGSDENKFASMRISELRKKAHKNGLNVDRSRETLIAAIKAVLSTGTGSGS